MRQYVSMIDWLMCLKSSKLNWLFMTLYIKQTMPKLGKLNIN